MRKNLRVLVLAMVLGVAGIACSGEGGDPPGGGAEGAASNNGAVKTETGRTEVEDELGHQAYQPSTRLVVPADKGELFDRMGRVLAGLAEGPLGVYMFVYPSGGDSGFSAWRDVADEEPEGHQLAYVTEGLLASGDHGVGPGDFEMVAQTDAGCAVLVAEGDPEVETLQWEDFEGLGDFVEAAKEDPGFVEVADPGAGTVYRAGTLALEEEIGIDLSPKSPAHKPPTQAVYDSEVEAALLPLGPVLLSDVLSGELKALAALAEERCPDLPGVPTSRELGYDVVVPVFGGIAAPEGTPPRVVEELGRAFVATSSSHNFERALAGSGRVPGQKGPWGFAGYVEEQERWLSRPEPEDPR